MDGKKSVILYCDIIHTVEKLDNETAGLLFKHYLRYVNDLEPKTDNQIVDIIFESIKQNLKRDLKKYKKKQLQWSEAGKRSAEVRSVKSKERMLTNVGSRSTDLTVNVNVNDNVNVNVNDILNKRKVQFKKLLNPFLEKYGSNLLKDFYSYWSEHNINGKKMRFEYSKNQPFDINRRLQTWLNRQDFKKEKNFAPKKEKINAGELLKQKYGLS
jgi:hypothetical protein